MENSSLYSNEQGGQDGILEFNKRNILSKRNFIYVVCAVLFVYFFFNLLLSAPTGFPVGAIVKIEKGSGLKTVSLQLKSANIIRSRIAFEALIIIFGGEKHVVGTDYYFEDKLPVWKVAERIAKGEHHMAPVTVTIPEGFTKAEIADAFNFKLADFNKDKFLAGTKGLEGYLFPDTYFFLTTDTEEDVIKSMRDNFEKKVSPVRPEIISAKKTEREIITMASIIEAEAKGSADRGIISGILWKRIKIGMPLQVDSAPDTYKTRGLPKIPIDNPGLAAITSAIHPPSSPYLYYLHDKDGNIHYARTFAEHRQNVLKYLK